MSEWIRWRRVTNNSKTLKQLLIILKNSFVDGRVTTTSLCPILGKRYAQIFNGACPKDSQNPSGKLLNISFIGPPPMITYKPVGGSDFLLIQLLAEKFRFIPKFVQEKFKNMVKNNGTYHGMVYSVSEMFS